MRNDVIELTKKYEVKTLGNKHNIEMLELEIQPDEILYYIAPTIITSWDRKTSKKTSLPGIVFFSNLRFLFQNRTIYDVTTTLEIMFLDIHSISSKGNGITGGHISFCTEDKRIEFLISYKKDIYCKVELLLADIVKKVINEHNNNIFVYNPNDEFIIVECLGCGATNIVHKNRIRQCAYCKRNIG